MNTRMLLGASAAAMAVAGVGLTFLPQELLRAAGAAPAGAAVLGVQLLGALYLGAAALNWMSRGVHIGGIYARPLSMFNFLHFAIGATTLVKGAIALRFAPEFAVAAAVYLAFAVAFGVVLFTHPEAPPAR
jgi:hypothetical protein